MPRVYRPRYGPPHDRRRCRTYWGDFSVKGQRFRIPLKTRDKKAALKLLADCVRREERRAAGVWDPDEVRAEGGIQNLLAAFTLFLEARGVSTRHLEARKRALREFVEAFHVRVAGDLDPGQVDTWITQLRARGLGAATINGRLRALKHFGRWLASYGRAPQSPFATIEFLNEAVDRRHRRRALSPTELDRLVRAARARPLAQTEGRGSVTRMSLHEQARRHRRGETRALLYAFCAGTGARRNEARHLRWHDLAPDASSAVVPAAHAKARREQRLVIPSELARALLHYRDRFGGGPEDFVFPREMFPTIRTFHADRAAAGIPQRDARGRVVDFHALRTTYISQLSAAGIPPRTAQALARHASLELTMQTYTDDAQLDLRAAAERIVLPSLASS